MVDPDHIDVETTQTEIVLWRDATRRDAIGRYDTMEEAMMALAEVNDG